MTGRGVSGAGVQVSRNACLSCHNTVMDRVVNKHGYRIVHSTCAASGPCDTCHGATAHGRQTRWIRTFVMEDCVSCHLEQRATTNCDACHVAKSTAERLASGPWQVTHGPNWRSTHGLGDTQLCATCHPPNYCVRCHHTPLPHGADFGGNHGTAARARDASCASCHNPTTFCLRCHGMPMPHPAGFLKMHSRVAKGSGDPLCLRCHYREDCDSCHAKHTHPGSTRGTLGGAKLPVIKP